ncbi:MAG: hypothetical protein QGF00_00895 [Planctomycetota bacterium]|nr:hypothetical protein [Planctomycetota bacterium]MDP7248134.1 hypothetical protein [Planctomycetota bacterium]
MNTRPRSIQPTIFAFALAAASFACADQDISRLTVRVNKVDKLSMTDGGSINLDQAVANVVGNQVVLGPVEDSTARLSFTHNSSSPMKIVAEAQSVPGNSDISLRVSVDGGAGDKVIVDAGNGTGVQEVMTDVQAGAFTDRAVTYAASCTSEGTPVEGPTDYGFTIVFTSVED